MIAPRGTLRQYNEFNLVSLMNFLKGDQGVIILLWAGTTGGSIESVPIITIDMESLPGPTQTHYLRQPQQFPVMRLNQTRFRLRCPEVARNSGSPQLITALRLLDSEDLGTALPAPPLLSDFNFIQKKPFCDVQFMFHNLKLDFYIFIWGRLSPCTLVVFQ